MKTVRINRAEIDPAVYNPNFSDEGFKCCYVGHILLNEQNKPQENDAWGDIFVERFFKLNPNEGYDLSAKFSLACDNRDEYTAIALAKTINIDLSFYGEYANGEN